MTEPRSKSRKVNGYVKAVRHRDKLAAQIAHKMTKIYPLKRRHEISCDAVAVRRAKLTGTQLAEAEKLLHGDAADAKA